MGEMITVSDSAVEKIKALIAEEQNPDLMVRMFVEGGGCSGFQYGFTFEEQKSEDDFVFEFNGITILVDAMSAQYVQGAEIDGQESAMGSTFAIRNPNATTTCGCGSSFSV